MKENFPKKEDKSKKDVSAQIVTFEDLAAEANALAETNKKIEEGELTKETKYSKDGKPEEVVVKDKDGKIVAFEEKKAFKKLPSDNN